ncbi:hypothetical protein A2914_00315 [Candidatus Nomurabacteria bacterium RIFCSPLOWO2_01_FULL_41_21]|uniref:Chloroplast import component protein (Tic20) n=2 Tax=Candidatus Nomuraibacteriota TaxID=1752729 RepID=A0A1F6V3V5_9BACT|nr:MAG: hypothetical protein A2733_02720 [Candidatus Nomurabacteria bacterium RIFCSPHIGHO2_01_FULL_40_20]OGI88798.1 MAG: hypothetical protein A2914_00315 [Candidatus Nomurabacteria bacterium RIFCSPLOWO2_01_FULL_41_21]
MDSQNNQNNTGQNMGSAGEKPADNAVKTPGHTHKMLFGILSYLGILVLVSLIVKKDDPFVKFHIKQGLVLFVISIIIWVLSSTLSGFGSSLFMLYKILNLGILILSIVGIVNVVQNKMKELPLVGGLARHFPI